MSLIPLSPLPYSQISETSLSCELMRYSGAVGRDPNPLIPLFPFITLFPVSRPPPLNPEAGCRWQGLKGGQEKEKLNNADNGPCFIWVFIYLWRSFPALRATLLPHCKHKLVIKNARTSAQAMFMVCYLHWRTRPVKQWLHAGEVRYSLWPGTKEGQCLYSQKCLPTCRSRALETVNFLKTMQSQAELSIFSAASQSNSPLPGISASKGTVVCTHKTSLQRKQRTHYYDETFQELFFFPSELKIKPSLPNTLSRD